MSLPEEHMQTRRRRRSTVAHAFATIVDALPERKVFAFGLGHVLNDLTAAVWFSYLLLLMHKVLGFASWKSACIMLAGQIADAATTPLVGLYSDRSRGVALGRMWFDRRHLWYCVGTLIVLLNFFFLFARCVSCDAAGQSYDEEVASDSMDTSANFAYFIIVAALFNVGWSCVQVSHMALLPELTSHTASRMKLNSVRYIATVASNLFVFALLAILVHGASLGLQRQFQTLAYVVLAVGLCTSILFLVGTEGRAQSRSEKQHAEAATKLAAAAQGEAFVQPSEVVVESVVVAAADAPASPSAAPGSRPSQDAIPPVDIAPAALGASAPASPVSSAPASPSSPPAAAPSTAVHGLPVRPPSFGLPPEREWEVAPQSLMVLPSLLSPEEELEISLKQLPVKFASQFSWMRQGEFWVCAGVYVCARIITVVVQSFLPYYVLDTLHLDTIYTAIMPCVLYVCSMLAAGGVQRAWIRFGIARVFYAASSLVVVGLAILLGLTAERPGCYVVYLGSMLVGLGQGALAVSATQFVVELVGSRTNTAAFVMGSCGFMDKLSGGIVLFALQSSNDDSARHVRLATTIPAMCAATLAAIVVYAKVDLNVWRYRHTIRQKGQKAQPAAVTNNAAIPAASGHGVAVEMQSANIADATAHASSH